MRIAAALLILALILSPLAIAVEGPGPEGPAILLLRDAVEKGVVTALGEKPNSYREVTLRLKSRASAPVDLDLCGAYLRPRPRRSCQRLGLGPEVTPRLTRRGGPGQILVTVPAGEEIELRLNTVCLDAGRSAPGRQVFDPAEDALPPVRETVMRWWADHPDAPQHAVNSAIWQNRETVHIAPGVVRGYERPSGTFGTLLGGTAYRLHDGELMSHAEDGIVRFLGTELFQVLPTPEGLYAIGLGEDRRPDLWRFALTGEEPWGRVMDLDVTERVKEVITPGEGRLVLVTDRGVRIVDTANDRTVTALHGERILDLTTRRPHPERLTVVLRIPAEPGYYKGGERKGESQDIFELWTVSLKSGKSDRVKRYWNVRSAAAGEAGVFGLTHRGILRMLVGDDFRDLPATEEYGRLLTVGRKTLWLVTPEGRLAAATPRGGAPLFATDITVDDGTAISLDPVTDDLAVVTDGWFRRVRAADGRVETVGPEPQDEEEPAGDE